MRRLFATVADREIEVTNHEMELDCRGILLETGIPDAQVYFYEGKEKIYVGRSVYAKRLPCALKTRGQ